MDMHKLACMRLQAESAAQARPGATPEPGPEPGHWSHLSDTHATEMTLEKVLESQAYMLFYERVV